MVVAKKQVKVATVCRVVNAFQALTDQFEHSLPSKKFIIKLPHVLADQEHQKQNSANCGGAMPQPGTDATRKKLPNPLTMYEQI